MSQACDAPDPTNHEKTCSLGEDHGEREHYFNVPQVVERTDGDYVYPHDVSYGVQLSEVYDGEAYRVLRDGRLVNRFHGEGSRRERAVQDVIDGIMRDRELAGRV